MRQDESNPVSKSQRKRDSHALLALAQRMAELDAAALSALDLPEEIASAVLEARGLDRRRSAYQRQLRYIAKLLRHGDAEPVQAGLEALERRRRQASALHHRAEALRARLLSADAAALPAVLDELPTTDPAQLRQLVQRAREDRPGAARALYRYLHEQLGARGDPSP